MRLLVSCMFLTLLIACSPEANYPEAYGTYLWDGTKWVDIGDWKSDITIRLEKKTKVKILLHDKMIGMVADNFKLLRKDKQRNIVYKDMNGSVRKVEKFNMLEIIDNNPIPGKISPVKNRQEMAVWEPKQDLLAGYYTAMTKDKQGEAFEIGIHDEGLKCFDLIKTSWGGIPTGVEDRFEKC